MYLDYNFCNELIFFKSNHFKIHMIERLTLGQPDNLVTKYLRQLGYDVINQPCKICIIKNGFEFDK